MNWFHTEEGRDQVSNAATPDAERLTQRDFCSISEGIRDFSLWVFLTLCRGGDWWDFRSRSVLPHSWGCCFVSGSSSAIKVSQPV